MVRKKQTTKQNSLFSRFGLIIFVPFIVFKWIGDTIIWLGKFFFTLEYKSYKKISLLFPKVISLLNLITRPFASPKKRTIFRYREFPKLRISLPRFKIPWPSEIFFTKVKFFMIGAFFISAISVLIQIDNIVESLPSPEFLSFRDVAATTKIYDRKGRLLYEIYSEENRTPIKLSEIPQIVKEGTIAIEDGEFLSHQGISFRGVARALYRNLTTTSLEGGSTITQQLIRSALLTPERTITRKIKEIVLSVWAERVYTKEQILEMYLNQVPYGGTAWGIEAAAETYFGKNVKDLNLGEAAFLAGLPASPTQFSPYGSRPELAIVRQKEVLKRMADLGYISKEEEKEAKEKTIDVRKPVIPISAPHFVMYVKEILEQQYGTNLVEHGGLRIVTSLDLDIQEMAQRTVTTQIGSLRSLGVGNGAALITNPDTGEILAMVGSSDYFDKEREGNVNLTTSLRQPGSSIKVVNYAAALSFGFTSASILDDSPVSFNSPGGKPYAPVNYDGKYHGKIPLRVALASSYNIPAVRVLSTIGIAKMIEQGKLMGIESWTDEERYGLSLTLGGAEVTMVDMARVYGVLAANGVKHNLSPILKITDWKGESLPIPLKKEDVQAVSPEIAFILSDILSDNSARAPAFGPNSSLVIPGKTVAVKTGTSDNKRDNWTIGYTPDYVVAVWVGNNNNAPMNRELTSGVTGAAPIWNEIITNLLKDKADKPFYKNTNLVSLFCRGKIEYFLKGTQPKGGCPLIITPTLVPSP